MTVTTQLPACGGLLFSKHECFSFWQTHLQIFSQLWNAWIPVILTTPDNEIILSNFDRWQKKSQREDNTLKYHYIQTINGIQINQPARRIYLSALLPVV
jgi:hypothetical protein